MTGEESVSKRSIVRLIPQIPRLKEHIPYYIIRYKTSNCYIYTSMLPELSSVRLIMKHSYRILKHLLERSLYFLQKLDLS